MGTWVPLEISGHFPNRRYRVDEDAGSRLFSANMEWLTDPQIWISLLTLTGLEIVLGIDNIIFISILAGKLPREQQGKGRQIGLMLALITRIALLCSISWLMRLTAPLFTLPVPYKRDCRTASRLLVSGIILHRPHASPDGLLGLVV